MPKGIQAGTGRNWRIKNLISLVFGRLTVLQEAGTARDGCALWLCRCLCGNLHIARGEKLRKRETVSCGCFRAEYAALAFTTHGHTRRNNRPKEYAVWSDMKRRCSRPNHQSYHNYGGRGIRVCKRWMSYADFIADMGPCPSGFSLDRINVNGNYEPLNCRWTDNFTQANNRRDNRTITKDGKTLTHAQWERELGFCSGTIGSRIEYGFPPDELLKPLIRTSNNKGKKRLNGN